MGDGSHISFCYDSWLYVGPLVDILGRQIMKRSGFSGMCTLALLGWILSVKSPVGFIAIGVLSLP